MWQMWISKKTWVSYGFLWFLSYLYSVSLKSAASTNFEGRVEALLRAGRECAKAANSGDLRMKMKRTPTSGVDGDSPLVQYINSG